LSIKANEVTNSDLNHLSLNPACGWKPWLSVFPSYALQ